MNSGLFIYRLLLHFITDAKYSVDRFCNSDNLFQFLSVIN